MKCESMFYAVMYFNLRDSVTDKEFSEKVKKYATCLQAKTKGIGPFKLYCHYFFGANTRRYQLWVGFEDFHAVEKEKEAKNDPEVARRLKEMNDLVEMKEHIDELVMELPI
jgi:hypothetical protein